jgi:hypothetical protein
MCTLKLPVGPLDIDDKEQKFSQQLHCFSQPQPYDIKPLRSIPAWITAENNSLNIIPYYVGGLRHEARYYMQWNAT